MKFVQRIILYYFCIMNKHKNKTALNMRIDSQLKEQLQKDADVQGMTLTSYITYILKSGVKPQVKLNNVPTIG